MIFPAEWGPLLGPAATLLAALIAFIGVFLLSRIALSTLEQKRLADARDQWTKRAQWAMDHALSKDERERAAGFAVLRALIASDIPGPEERRILLEFTQSQRQLPATHPEAIETPIQGEERP